MQSPGGDGEEIIVKLIKISKIACGQDGAIFGDLLFRFDTKGVCTVYSVNEVLSSETPSPVSNFTLDRCAELCPHSNSVAFGNEYYSDGDEFPLLYTNIYNNYSSSENKLKGVTCIYRITRDGAGFISRLVGMIETAFTETDLWASPSRSDVRPYGNFAIDCRGGKYYAFTMLDEPHITRYFEFPLPKLSDGVYSPELELVKITLTEDRLLSSFDCEYHNFIQGAAFRDGCIYSLEGFSVESGKIPLLRVIDVNEKKELATLNFVENGADTEPELIDFYKDRCIYSDGHGDVYIIEKD